jgi:hypothetical protein
LALDGVILFKYSRTSPATVNIQTELAIDRQKVPEQQRPHSMSCLTTEMDKKLNKIAAKRRLDKETIWGSLWFGEFGGHAAIEDDCYPFAPG